MALIELTLTFMELLLQNGNIHEFKRFVGFDQNISSNSDSQLEGNHPLIILINHLLNLELEDEQKKNDLLCRLETITDKLRTNNPISSPTYPNPFLSIELLSQRVFVKPTSLLSTYHFGDNVLSIQQAMNSLLPSEGKMFGDLIFMDEDIITKTKVKRSADTGMVSKLVKRPKFSFTKRNVSRDFRHNPNTSRPPSVHVDEFMEMEKTNVLL